MAEKFFGYDETEIKRVFNSREMEPVHTVKVDEEKTTTAFLVEGSAELLKENREFLKEISTY